MLKYYSMKLPKHNNSFDTGTRTQQLTPSFHGRFILLHHLEGKSNDRFVIDGPQFDQIGEERDQLALNRRLERRFIRRGWREMNPREVRHDRQNVVDENVRLLEKARALAEKTQLEGKTLPAKSVDHAAHHGEIGGREGGRVQQTVG